MKTLTLSIAANRTRSSDVRELLKYAQLPGMISLAGGLPDPALFDVAGIDAATAEVFANEARSALQYGQTDGQVSLREAVTGLMKQRGANVAPENVLITSGSQQALDLVARSILNEGDFVAVERPSYLAALQIFHLLGAETVSIPVDGDGAVVDALLSLPADKPKPKLLYLVSNFANPSGATLTLARREKLVRWAVENEVFVLEDDPYGALRYRGSPEVPLVALAEKVPGALEWVGYLSSFSKIMAPGLRIGWAVLPAVLHDACVRIKQALDLHTSTFNQAIAARYLASGRLESHLDTVCKVYGERAEALASALTEAFGDKLRFNRPDGGMFLWGRFEDGTNARELLYIAREKGMIFVPGDVFYPDTPDTSAIRFSFVTVDNAGLLEGVKRLKAAYDEMKQS
ncbi:PLP-dependent aminotransferase family protein [Leeia sp. TBRC 13508]|uniref:Putative 8-amino-7-oxononanoate synthase n=1 Tax=Leeia speluncae TaxID=2884804 RepID=A0ABS8DAG9_9NEIS|nr:PLP-dependent aminotransferase family protein [Leeia speluncae]MCB6185211.1 PLP-dependent aminotransferase family protein [Leeia speluncae]